MQGHVWAVVLAAGSGRRLASVTGGIPKQFWTLDGDRSLLERTLSRLAPTVPLNRTVIVVDHAHRSFIEALSASTRDAVVYQPSDRGTAAGMLFALMPVLDTDPDAVVVMTPSDHAVRDRAMFQTGIDAAIERIWSDNPVVLFGVEASSADRGYGWIVPAAEAGERGFDRVAAFVEKPDADAARRLYAARARWNTMVTVGRASALLQLFEPLPWLTAIFEAARRLPASAREPFLAEEYRRLPPADFSRDVLERAHGLLTWTWPAAMGWCDLGTPERLGQWRDARSSEARGALVATTAA
jgi:mannose-1-phosphate guanylyltransferase